jgi:hypothetical protein
LFLIYDLFSNENREFDVARLTAETYFKYYGLSVENTVSLFSKPETIKKSSKKVFELYKKLKVLDKNYYSKITAK